MRFQDVLQSSVRYNFAWCIPYETNHPNGKMNSKTYIRILKRLQSYLLELGVENIMYKDLDSAHVSKESMKWIEKHGFDYINGCSSSPDLSIMKTWVSPIKNEFYKRTCRSKAESIVRFYKV
jgi:hypothetical protein